VTRQTDLSPAREESECLTKQNCKSS